MPNRISIVLSLAVVTIAARCGIASPASSFEGKFYRGDGDAEYLRLLDTSRRMFVPDCEYQNLPMLYMPSWNGLVEGPTWDAWWIQNSYGTTYGALPFLVEPFTTFLQNSQDLWFDQMGDGKRVGAPPPFNWVAPDGALCDAARPGWIVYRQGDGRVSIHDWGMEFTAAGLLMQSELLLIGRDPAAIARYLPKLERCAGFIETRRDSKNNLFLVGPAGNLLAPSYAGWKKPDGAYGQAYLTGLSVTYIAALDRLIELEKLAGRAEQARTYADQRAAARKGLSLLTTDEGYLIRSLDPDGTRHGVFGAARHGYFEASPNHDAIAFRVVDDQQARRIYDKIASIRGLRPYHFILPNFPSYDDMYEKPEGLWAFGTWVNGGHWSTCEARMIMAYYRLGKFDDARASMKQLLSFAARFRMDNPLVKFGSDVYQPGQPVNLTYDAFGPPAAMLRGLFEYLYHADRLELRPHIPPFITRLEQRFPIRFGAKRIYLATSGSGAVSSVLVNGTPWGDFDADSISLPYEKLPQTAAIAIGLGQAKAQGFSAPHVDTPVLVVPPQDAAWDQLRRPNLAINDLPVRIGADSDGGSRFIGDITDVAIYKRALSADEMVAAAMRQGPPAADPSLVAAWSFGRNQNGGFAADTGQRLTAKVVGKVKLIAGEFGSGVRLDGQSYLEIADNPALHLSETITMMARVRPEKLPPSGGRIIDKSQVGTSNGYLLDTYPGNSLRLISQAGTLVQNAALTPGQWRHVAATVAPDGNLRLFIDGRLTAEKQGQSMPDIASLRASAQRIQRFHQLLLDNGLAQSYEAAHARLAVDFLATAHQRLKLLAEGKLKPLGNPASQVAADQSYIDTASKLCDGLDKAIRAKSNSTEAREKYVVRFWEKSR